MCNESSVFHISFHHDGAWFLRNHQAAGQHKRMDFSLYDYSTSSRLWELISRSGRGQKGRLRKKLRSARTYEVSDDTSFLAFH